MQALQSAFTGRPFAAPKAAAVRSSSARQSFVVRAAVQAAPEALPVLKLDGSSAGEAQIALRTAGDETANGLVHRYLVYVRQNARQVGHATAGNWWWLAAGFTPLLLTRMAFHSTLHRALPLRW
jgi:hypothetical protein